MNTYQATAATGSRNSMIRQRLQRLARLAILWAVMVFPLSVHAQTYDAAVDFSVTTPQLLTNIWTYGSKPVSNLGSGTFTLYQNVLNYGPDVRLWTHSTFIDTPFMSRNTNTTNPVNDGLTLWTPGQLISHAGNATASVLRFTVPVTGVYTGQFSFSNQSQSFSGTNVAFYYNSLLVVPYTLGAFGDTVGDSFTPWLLNAGDILEFMVAPRDDTSANSTSTGIDVQFTTMAAVPEPASLALIGCSAAMAGAVVWYRRRRQLRMEKDGVDFP